MGTGRNHWRFWIDTGGTFTDCMAINPEGLFLRTKVLSSSRLRGRIAEVNMDHKLVIETKWNVSKDIFFGYELTILGSGLPPLIIDHYDPAESILIIQDQADLGWVGRDFEITGHEEAPVLACRLLTETPLAADLPEIDMRLGSTKGTNALLERKGAKVTFLVTKGFKDLVAIGTQQRPHLFELDIKKKTRYTKGLWKSRRG